MIRVYVALGSNIGDRQHYLETALKRLVELGEIRQTSSWIETPYEGPSGPQEDYLNGVVHLETMLAPMTLIRGLLDIEQRMGRDRRGRISAPREIDLDLLDYDGQRLETPELTLPHPRMHLRRFVLAPLVELNPEWVHPAFSKTAAQLLHELSL